VSRKPTRSEGLTFESLRRQIAGGHIAPLYLFIGEERYLHESALGALYDTIDPELRAFNVSVFTIGSDNGAGLKTTVGQALDAANQMPMMSPRRIVVIRDFDKIKEDEQEQVFTYLKRPSPLTAVVFQALSPDKRRKLTGALMKACVVVTFGALDDQRAQQWATDYLRQLNCRIEPAALSLLIRLAGTDLTRLVNELEKLAAYSDGEKIDAQAVQDLVPRAREHANWELWDAISSGDRKRALRLMERLLDDSDALPILGSLASYYRKLLVGKDLLDSGEPQQVIKDATGQWSQSFFGRLRGTPRAAIVHGLERIAQVDNAIKNSEGTPRLQMQYLIAELTLPPTPR
jgi:DNA polymerase-3 subunit delta